MSIIPGIETAAPERTETSSGSSSDRRSACRSAPRAGATCSSTSASSPSGRSPSRHVRAAGVGRDREPGGHGHAERGHLREADALAAEELAAAARRARRSRRRSSSSGRMLSQDRRSRIGLTACESRQSCASAVVVAASTPTQGGSPNEESGLSGRRLRLAVLRRRRRSEALADRWRSSSARPRPQLSVMVSARGLHRTAHAVQLAWLRATSGTTAVRWSTRTRRTRSTGCRPGTRSQSGLQTR